MKNVRKCKFLAWIVAVCLLASMIPGTAFAATTTNGWDNSQGYYVYYRDGEMICDEVAYIDGYYYGFDWSGEMYDDTTFGMDDYDEETDEYLGSYYYRAKSGGKLYVNEWFESVWGDWYYYGAEGKGAEDFTQIGGTWYFFEEARMLKDTIVWSEKYQANYYISADGKTSVEAPYNGWLDAGEGYYYFVNGEAYEDGIYEIDGYYYGFCWDGEMYDDTTFGMDEYDENGDWIGYYYCRAKSGGKLYVNEWYESEYGEYYYYGAEGKGAEDFTEVDGDEYFFEEARMLRDTIVYSEKYQKRYYIGEDGTTKKEVPENGWWHTGEDYYYFANGEAYQYGVYLINGAYYGFHWNGRMYDDTTFDFWDEELGRWVYYRAKAGGKLYVNEWYEDDWGDWYYYGAEGKAPTDFTKLGGNWYYFYNDGRMASDEIVWSDKYQANYYISEDGTTSVKAPYNGWWHVGEDYYYFVNGEAYEGGVYLIGGAYYSFHYSGKMYDGVTFGFWDSELDRWVYYRAREGGKLYVNEWYENEYGDWYYYGAEGKAPTDFTKLGGNWYYFYNDGRMASDEIVWSNKYQANYYISEDGTTSVKAPYNGWWPAGEDYYYFVNGEACADGIYQIGGKYYGFAESGRMYTNTSFEMWNSALGGYSYHRAKADGTLYMNEWYQSGINYYYYGEAGGAARDFTKIGGTWYYFNYNGRMIKNQLVYSDLYNGYYKISKDGKSSTAVSNGWESIDSDYYYIKDGRMLCDEVAKIGDKYYGFDYEGQMRKDEPFSVESYDEGLDEWVYAIYRAKKDGTLYVNEWYQDGNTWCYYGADGKAPSDFTQIGGKWYFFEDACMVTDRLVYSYNYGRLYVISADGTSSTAVTKDGWVKVGDDYYYVLDGSMLWDEAVKIGSKYYVFDYDGKMVVDETYYSYYYDEDEGYERETVYRAKKDGTLYVNEWYEDDWGDWYYYGPDGKTPRGRTKLGNAWYYFDNEGRMVTGTVADSYAYGADGKQVTATGKQDIGSGFVYVKADGTVAYEEWVQIGSKWYYFDPIMASNTIFKQDGKLYIVDNGGASTTVTANGIHDIGTDGKVYLENGKLYAGWKQIGGAWYYFDLYMYSNGVYTIKGDKYVFDRNGKLFKGGWLMINSDYYDGQSYVYADASGKALTGLQSIGGQLYYFNNSGRLQANTTVTVKGVLYAIDGAGKATALNGNGWKKIGDNYYYLQNGQVLTGLQSIDGKLYYFYSDGEMAADTVCYSGNGDIVLGADGAAMKGWIQLGGEWMYADENYEICYGKQTIGGKEYIFAGSYKMSLMTGTFWWDGKIVTTDDSGAIISEKDPADGWIYADQPDYYNENGEVYYYKNGEAYNGWVGDYLIRSGHMLINTYASWEGDYYAFDVYGKYVKKGWHRFNYGGGDYSEYVYAKSGGKLCYNEWYVIDGSWYYFDGVYMASGIVEIDGEFCRFADNGKYLGKVSGADGWVKTGSDWVYLHAGEPVTGINWIDGQRYVFDYSGILLKNGFVSTDYGLIYVDASGKIPNYTGWKKINGEWCYFDSSNLPVTGWFQDGGKIYYGSAKLDKNDNLTYGLKTGYYALDGKLYYFDASGVYVGEKGVENGWFNAGGEYYYFRNGELLYGHQQIGGKGYYFSGGVMVKDEIQEGHYYDKSGAQRTTKGWYQTSEGWIYVKGDGDLANGVQKIGGKEYYFRNYIMIR